jgi:putative redox protein
MTQVSARIGREHYLTTIKSQTNTLFADEPEDAGGTDQGFAPDELFCSSLAACTSITLRMYADRKEWPLEAVEVSVRFERSKTGDATTTLFREIHLTGDLSDEQKQRLISIANLCPMHKTLSNPIVIETVQV